MQVQEVTAMKKLTMLITSLLLLLLLLLGSHTTTGIPLGDFYPFGTGALDTSLPPLDDGSSGPISLPSTFSIFDEVHSTFYVSQPNQERMNNAVAFYSVVPVAGSTERYTDRARCGHELHARP